MQIFGSRILGESLVVCQILAMSRDIKKANKQEFAKLYLPKVSDGKFIKKFIHQTLALYGNDIQITPRQ